MPTTTLLVCTHMLGLHPLGIHLNISNLPTATYAAAVAAGIGAVAVGAPGAAGGWVRAASVGVGVLGGGPQGAWAYPPWMGMLAGNSGIHVCVPGLCMIHLPHMALSLCYCAQAHEHLYAWACSTAAPVIPHPSHVAISAMLAASTHATPQPTCSAHTLAPACQRYAGHVRALVSALSRCA